MSVYEAIVVAVDAGKLDSSVRALMGSMADQMWARLIEVDFFRPCVEFNSSLYPPAVHALWRSHQDACPFLQDDRCSIYKFRPLRCQTYYVRRGFRHTCESRSNASPSFDDEYGQVIQGLASRCYEARLFGFNKPMKPLPMPVALAFACWILNHGPDEALARLGLTERESETSRK
jgi:Fe-S-cluster containining protein